MFSVNFHQQHLPEGLKLSGKTNHQGCLFCDEILKKTTR
jgi:hypothetical protein